MASVPALAPPCSAELLAGVTVTDIDEAADLNRKIFMQHAKVQSMLDRVWYTGGAADAHANTIGYGIFGHIAASSVYFLALPYYTAFKPESLSEINRPKQRFWLYQIQYTALLVSILSLKAVEDTHPAEDHVLDVVILFWLGGMVLSEYDEALKARRHSLSRYADMLRCPPRCSANLNISELKSASHPSRRAAQGRLRHNLSWFETFYEHVLSSYWNTMVCNDL